MEGGTTSTTFRKMVFPFEVIVLLEEVTGAGFANEAFLETKLLRKQFHDAVTGKAAGLATWYTKTVTGDTVTYSWEDEATGRMHTLSREPAVVTGVQGPVFQWSFKTDTMADATVLNAYAGFLDDDMRSDFDVAILDTAKDIFTKSTIGAEESFSWQSRDRGRSYVMSASRTVDPATGAPAYAKWGFSTQMTLSRAALARYVPSFEDPEMAAALSEALRLDDFDPLGSVTLSLTGRDISISWRSQDLAKSCTLGLTTAKTLKTETRDADGNVTDRTYEERPKWSFAVSTKVLKAAVSGSGAEFETDAAERQYLDALDILADDLTDNVDNATVFTKVVSGRSVSYSWQDLDGYTTHRLPRRGRRSMTLKPKPSTGWSASVVMPPARSFTNPRTRKLKSGTSVPRRWCFAMRSPGTRTRTARWWAGSYCWKPGSSASTT